MKMSLHENLILKQLRHEIDKGCTIDNIEIQKAGMMECCQTDDIKYYVAGRMGISPTDISDIVSTLVTSVTYEALMEIHYESGYLDSLLLRTQKLKGVRWAVESYFDENDKPRHLYNSLNVKKIIVTRLVKSKEYPDIVVPHKTIVRVVE